MWYRCFCLLPLLLSSLVPASTSAATSSRAQACASSLEAVALRDMRASWVTDRLSPEPGQLLFDFGAAARALVQCWEAYAKPLDEFMDEFEVTYTRGFDRIVTLERSI